MNEMEASSSFKFMVGSACSYDRQDRSKLFEVVPLVSCNKDEQGHKSAWCFAGVKNESELNLARAGIFYMSAKDINALTICPFHRSELGEGARIPGFRIPNDCRDVSPDLSRSRESCTGIGRHNRYERGFGLCDSTVQTKHKILESAFTAFNKPERSAMAYHGCDEKGK